MRRVSTTTFAAIQPGSRSLAHTLLFSLAVAQDPFRDWTPDVLLVEATPYSHLPLMRRWVRDAGYPVVLDVHEAWHDYILALHGLDRLSAEFARFALRRGLTFADRVASGSSATAQSVSENYGYPSEKIWLVPNGFYAVDLETGRVGGNGKMERGCDFVAIGRLVRMKRFDEFIHALNELRSRRTWDGRAVIVGTGPEEAELRRMIARMGLEGNVTILSGLGDTDKFRWLRESKVLVHCSSREGFSISTLEAQACGVVPIVARPLQPEVFGVGDLVEGNVSGLVYDSGDVARLVSLMDLILRDEPLRARLRDEGMRRASGFEWNAIGRELDRRLREFAEVQ